MVAAVASARDAALARVTEAERQGITLVRVAWGSDSLPALPHYLYIFACLLGVLECSLLLVDRAWLLDVG